ncbi:MAG: hypothetical protein E7666_07885 [Ruminococcaceae bacterium]|nr:hypothetical protein [Oscillospiraceae bacterium]
MSVKILRLTALFLSLILCLAALPACQKSDPLTPAGFTSMTVDAKGKTLTASIKLDALTLQKHAGGAVYLYELLPGQTVASSRGAKPIASAKIASNVRLSADLYDGERSRLYSSFVIGFEDGSLLSRDGHYVDNPEILAADKTPFAWTSTPKGLFADDAEDAAALHTAHVAYELSLAALSAGDALFSHNGTAYSYQEALLHALDGKINTASDAGMQVSLRILLDTDLDANTAAALFTLLAKRYSGEAGLVTAFLLIPTAAPADSDDTAQLAKIATLCRMAALALRSHVANGRIYVHHSAPALHYVKAFFINLQNEFDKGGELDWGISLLIDADQSLDVPTVTVESLPTLTDLLTTSTRRGASWIAVELAPIDATDPDLQAATYAYQYYTAALIRPSMIFYPSHIDRDPKNPNGLRGDASSERLLTSVYKGIDSGLGEDMLALCRATWGEKWNDSLPTLSSRGLSGSTSAGVGGMGEQMLFDFRENTTHGFGAVASLDDVALRDSQSLNAPVLYVWADNQSHAPAGIRKQLPSAACLENVLSLSVQFLSQSAAGSCTATLRIDGYAPDGTRLIYESSAAAKSTSWQTVTYQISSFSSAADLSRPCTISFTVAPDGTEDEPYPIWISGILSRTPEQTESSLLPLFLILGGAALGGVGIWLIYRQTAAAAERRAKKRRRVR